MPFVVDLYSHDILEIFDVPGKSNKWVSVSLDVKRFLNQKWEYFPARGLINQEYNLLIVQDVNDAHDIEYFLRENHLVWNYCNPVDIVF